MAWQLINAIKRKDVKQKKSFEDRDDAKNLSILIKI